MKNSILLFVLGLITSIVFSQDVKLKYISPVPGSRYIMPENNIALRYGEVFDVTSVKSGLIEVADDRGNLLEGQLVFSDDERTLIFLPESPYPLDSKINVSLKKGLRTKSGLEIEAEEFSFYTTKKVLDVKSEAENGFISELSQAPLKKPSELSYRNPGKDNNYPEGYAYGEVWIDNNPPPGYYFYCANDEWFSFDGTLPFTTIVDRYGIPVYYRKFENKVYDLKTQPGGCISCYTYHPYWGNLVFDSAFNIIDKYQMGNGYNYTDFHDFQMLENGHVFVMTFDNELVDMSLVVPGGNPEAAVSGFVFQELDNNHNVVFQWRSWDHFEITETGPEVNLLGETIDYVHGNTVEVESDTSVLISSRNFHEITKIDRNSGEIIWRFGGSQNEFEFLNDTLGWSRQHDSRRIYNGHVTLYDNGTYHPVQISSALEYELNTDQMTATLVNRYRHEPDYFGQAMGNAFWTPDETVVVGWGTETPGITEFDLDGNPLWELYFFGMNYRAYRLPWKTNRFTLEKDTMHYGYIWKEDSLSKKIKIENPKDEALVLTSYHSHHDNYQVENEFPITVPANGSADIWIKFLPDSTGYYEDVLTFNADINSDTLVQRIAQQLTVRGYATENQSVAENGEMLVRVFPNPARDYFYIESSNDESLDFIVMNVLGQEVFKNQTLTGKSLKVSTRGWEQGVYFIKVKTDDQQDYTSKIIVK